MRLVRYGNLGHEKPGLMDADGNLRDLSSLVADIDGASLDAGALARLRKLDPRALPKVEGSPRLGACIGKSSKVIGVAINYRMHGVETGSKQPTEPTLFLKAPSAICGATDDILLPPGS